MQHRWGLRASCGINYFFRALVLSSTPAANAACSMRRCRFLLKRTATSNVKWTKQEENELVRSTLTHSIESLSIRHSRTSGSIRNRLQRLGVSVAAAPGAAPAADIESPPSSASSSSNSISIGESSIGRVVRTHSTYVDRMLPVLEELALHRGVHTVIPGRLARARTSTSSLTLRITTALPRKGGWKLIARRGSQTQEVFVVGAIARPELEQALELSLAAADAPGQRERDAAKRRSARPTSAARTRHQQQRRRR